MTSPHVCMRDILYVGFGHDEEPLKPIIVVDGVANHFSYNIRIKKTANTKFAPPKLNAPEFFGQFCFCIPLLHSI